jgi:hypothetical protein
MSKVEIWLNGPVVGIDSLLQPVAHALLAILRAPLRGCLLMLAAKR